MVLPLTDATPLASRHRATATSTLFGTSYIGTNLDDVTALSYDTYVENSNQSSSPLCWHRDLVGRRRRQRH